MSVITMTISYDGKTYVFKDPDGLQCMTCGEPYVSEEGAAVMLMHSKLAPRGKMNVSYAFGDRRDD